jgi:hypothetical protein
MSTALPGYCGFVIDYSALPLKKKSRSEAGNLPKTSGLMTCSKNHPKTTMRPFDKEAIWVSRAKKIVSHEHPLIKKTVW